MGYKINGEVIISNSKDIDNVGIATMDLVDAKVSAKAITEQTEGTVSDVTGADEVLIYDAEGGSLLRVTVDEFISGSGIGTLVSDFDSLNVTGITTVNTLKGIGTNPISFGSSLSDVLVSGMLTADRLRTGDIATRNVITLGITTIQDHLEVNDSTGSGTEYNFNVKTNGSSTFGVLGNGHILLGNNAGAPFMATNDHHATSKKYVDDAISASAGGGGSGVNQFTAVGNIPNGAAVALNIDGTVGMVTTSEYAETSINTSVQYTTVATDSTRAVYDSANDKVVVVYDDSSAAPGKAVVGTVSGTTISFGTPVAISANNCSNFAVTYDSANDKVVIAYTDNNNNSYGTAVVGTVSGTSISFGTPTVFNSATTREIAATFDASNDKVVIAYKDVGNNDYGTASVGTVSGTSISFGTSALFRANRSDYISATFDTTNSKVVIAFQNYESSFSQPGRAVVGEVEGTNIFFGTSSQFASGRALRIASVYDPSSGKTIIAFYNNSNSGRAIVSTVSGTSISFGTEVSFESANVRSISMAYHPTLQQIFFVYGGTGSATWPVTRIGTVSGTSISFTDNVVIESGASVDTNQTTATVYDPVGGQMVVAYSTTNTNDGKGVVLTPPYKVGTLLTSENYIGIAATSISDGATGDVTTLGGVNTQQTGLTTARTYYVQTDASFGLIAGNPSVVAGTSISDTKMIVR
jgi:hypothetical protein